MLGDLEIQFLNLYTIYTLSSLIIHSGTLTASPGRLFTMSTFGLRLSFLASLVRGT